MDALYSSVAVGKSPTSRLRVRVKRKEDKLRSVAPLGPFSVLVIASGGKMVEYCFLSSERTLERRTKSAGFLTPFRRWFPLKHSAARRFAAREICW